MTVCVVVYLQFCFHISIFATYKDSHFIDNSSTKKRKIDSRAIKKTIIS